MRHSKTAPVLDQQVKHKHKHEKILKQQIYRETKDNKKIH